MKKHFCIYALLFATLLLFTGCSKDEDSDISGTAVFSVSISVQDKDGRDLLDPGIEGNLISNPPVAYFHGKDYELTTPLGYRPNNDFEFWLIDKVKGNNPENRLKFAHLQEFGVCEEEPLLIKWSDGSIDVITITIPEGVYHLQEHPRLRLNGREVDNLGVKIIK